MDVNDKLSYYFSKAINTLFLYNVIGTSYGVLFGILLLSIQDMIALFYQPIGLIKWYGFIAFGVLVFNAKTAISKKYLDPELEKKLKYLNEMAKAAKIKGKEEKAIWREAINNFIFQNHETANGSDNNDNSHNITLE